MMLTQVSYFIQYLLEKARKIREKRLARAVKNSDMFPVHSTPQRPVRRITPKSMSKPVDSPSRHILKPVASSKSPYVNKPKEQMTGTLVRNSTLHFSGKRKNA